VFLRVEHVLSDVSGRVRMELRVGEVRDSVGGTRDSWPQCRPRRFVLI
jgi:hypothetical protein